MQQTFQKVDPNTYELDSDEVTLVFVMKPNTYIELDTPKHQINRDKTSCLWYYKDPTQGFPDRCMPSSNYEQLLNV